MSPPAPAAKTTFAVCPHAGGWVFCPAREHTRLESTLQVAGLVLKTHLVAAFLVHDNTTIRINVVVDWADPCNHCDEVGIQSAICVGNFQTIVTNEGMLTEKSRTNCAFTAVRCDSVPLMSWPNAF